MLQRRHAAPAKCAIPLVGGNLNRCRGACALHNDRGRRDESVGWRALGPAITADRSAPTAGRHTPSASLRRSSFLRSLGSSSFLRSLIAVGVTSTSSSSAI